MSIRWEDLRALAIDHVLPVAARLALVLALFLFGRAIARAVVRTLDRVLEHRNAETSLRKFIGDVAYAGMLAALGVVLLDTLGVKTTAVVAVLGAAGLAVGLALQGSLSNFAAGVMLVLLRPYRVGELVALGPHRGRVDAIRIFHTVLIAADHRQITIPNGQILAQPIENLSSLGRRRLDVTVSFGGAPELEAVRRALACDIARCPASASR